MATASVTIPGGSPQACGHRPRRRYKPVSQWDLPGDLSGVGGCARVDRRHAEARRGSGRARATPLDETIALALTPLHRLGDLESHIGYRLDDARPRRGRIYTQAAAPAGSARRLFFEREDEDGGGGAGRQRGFLRRPRAPPGRSGLPL
jgi:hypothetical protein